MGKSQFCLGCSGKLYRELKRYYDKGIVKSSDDSNKDSIIKTPQDYINRFIIKANDKLDNDIIV